VTSSRPYLIRAMHAWLTDNELTPYILVDALFEGVQVPQQHVKKGKIVLNLGFQAIGELDMGLAVVYFKARFDGIVHEITAPVMAVEAIYAFENGRGMTFGEEQDTDPPPEDDGGGSGDKGGSSEGPFLRVVK
jgi:stringent starvation protein B